MSRQQREWWADELRARELRGMDKLPAELRRDVVRLVDGFPIGTEDAKEVRVRLMDERGWKVEEGRKEFEMETFNLCEH